ncbi:MAG: hypothetical protein WCC12_00845 [Anaerolineales bacterium]
MPVGLAFCAVLALIFIAIIVVIFVRANRKPDSLTMAKRSPKGWRNWIGYIGVALILALWSLAAALFFLGIVWIIRQNPNPDADFQVGDEQKKKARRVYTWLFLSSILTVPFFLIMVIASYSGNTANNQLVLAALVPVLFHLPLLLGLTSKSVFVYRHTQQGVLLVALRAGLAAIAVSIGDDPGEGAWLFLLGNSSLWLFGSLWGWIEINRGSCWWMKQKRDAARRGRAELLPPEPDLSPETYMERGKWYLQHQQKDAAKAYALEAFRHGSFEIRRQAIQLLDDMNEVSFF